MIDVPWNGFASRRRSATCGDIQHNVPRITITAISRLHERELVRGAANVRIMEIDVDESHGKTSSSPPCRNRRGHMKIPAARLGHAINEEVARAHPWDPPRFRSREELALARSY